MTSPVSASQGFISPPRFPETPPPPARSAGNTVNTTGLEKRDSKDAVQAFREQADMSAYERYFQNALSRRGLTEDSLAAMTPEEQRQILDEIREEFQRAMEEEATRKALRPGDALDITV